eukprot:m.96573 g.96573  ORF g.96573 m.96573 type:complete len:847 (+) comp13551_c1_seq2:279-2819(+)
MASRLRTPRQSVCLPEASTLTVWENQSDTYLAEAMFDAVNTSRADTLDTLIACRFTLKRSPSFELLLNGSGDSLMHVAASKGDVDCMLVLLLHGASASKMNKAGLTPLHIACNHCTQSVRYAHLIHTLLKYGARRSKFKGTRPREIVENILASPEILPEEKSRAEMALYVFDSIPDDCVVVLGGPEWAPCIKRGIKEFDKMTRASKKAPLFVYSGSCVTSEGQQVLQLTISEGLPCSSLVVEAQGRSCIQQVARLVERICELEGHIVVVTPPYQHELVRVLFEGAQKPPSNMRCRSLKVVEETSGTFLNFAVARSPEDAKYMCTRMATRLSRKAYAIARGELEDYMSTVARGEHQACRIPDLNIVDDPEYNELLQVHMMAQTAASQSDRSHANNVLAAMAMEDSDSDTSIDEMSSTVPSSYRTKSTTPVDDENNIGSQFSTPASRPQSRPESRVSVALSKVALKSFSAKGNDVEPVGFSDEDDDFDDDLTEPMTPPLKKWQNAVMKMSPTREHPGISMLRQSVLRPDLLASPPKFAEEAPNIIQYEYKVNAPRGRLVVLHYNVSSLSNAGGQWGEFPMRITKVIYNLHPDVVVLTGIANGLEGVPTANIAKFVAQTLQEKSPAKNADHEWKVTSLVTQRRRKSDGESGVSKSISIITRFYVEEERKIKKSSGIAALGIKIFVKSGNKGMGTRNGKPIPWRSNVGVKGTFFWIFGAQFSAETPEDQRTQAQDLVTNMHELLLKFPCIISSDFKFKGTEASPAYKYLIGAGARLNDRLKGLRSRFTYPVRSDEDNTLVTPVQRTSLILYNNHTYLPRWAVETAVLNYDNLGTEIAASEHSPVIIGVAL